MHYQGMKRKFLCVVLFVLCAAWNVQVLDAIAAAGESQQSKTGVIRLVVPFTPGGGTDITARVIALGYKEVLGKTVIIENRPGGNLRIGTRIVANAAPDGRTILLTNFAHATNPYLYKKLPYDSEKDFAPISLVNAGAMMVLVHPSLPVKTLSELIAYVKSKPGQLNYSSPGVGTPPYLSMEMLKSRAGLDIVHVPYPGASPAIADLLGNQVQISAMSAQATRPLVETGKLRAIAFCAAQRSPVFPEVPTVAEAGLPGFELTSWHVLLAPGKTPKDIINRLSQDTTKVLKSSLVREKWKQLGYIGLSTTPEETAAHISSEIQRFSKLLKSLGLKPQ